MILAVQSWPEAAIAIAGILFITTVVSVALWQIFATGRTGMTTSKEKSYRKLAEESAELQRRTAASLEKTATELEELRLRTAELERLLKDVG
jgi:Tfp pilus assembly protein PilO